MADAPTEKKIIPGEPGFSPKQVTVQTEVPHPEPKELPDCKPGEPDAKFIQKKYGSPEPEERPAEPPQSDLTNELNRREAERQAERKDTSPPKVQIQPGTDHPVPNRPVDTMDELGRAKRPEDPTGEAKSPPGEKIAGMGAGEEGQKVLQAVKTRESRMQIGADLGESKHEPDTDQLVQALHDEMMNSSMGYRRRYTKLRDDNKAAAQKQQAKTAKEEKPAPSRGPGKVGKAHL